VSASSLGRSAWPGSGRDRRILSPLRGPVADRLSVNVGNRAGKATGFDAAGDFLQGIQHGGGEPSPLKLLTFAVDADGETFFGFGH
jgi:hypothetical protein